MGQRGVACPKPEPLKRTKGRADRREAAVKKSVRAAVADRDVDCRYGRYNDPFTCAGQREWAHFGRYKRFKTRRMRPESRHCTEGSLLLCTKHHRQYDAGTLKITALTNKGCDGPLEFGR